MASADLKVKFVYHSPGIRFVLRTRRVWTLLLAVLPARWRPHVAISLHSFTWRGEVHVFDVPRLSWKDRVEGEVVIHVERKAERLDRSLKACRGCTYVPGKDKSDAA